MIVANIEIYGKKYKLQHPGNREWIKLKKSLVSLSEDKGNIDMEPLLDYCFEHVVFPEVGEKLNLDTVDLIDLEEVWGLVLPRFLRGQLDPEYKYKNKKRK